ncbi:MAG: HPr family phosphocarrier protein [Caldisericum exile]|uniref:HPr family phosphocarrier protein n=1 Tax=Caldisericum exile TaxID=693075 RepID=UPI003C71B525
MLMKTFTVKNKVGLHARPAAVLVQTASKFKSDIKIEKDGKVVSAKSILGVLSLGAEKGSTITVTVDGVDEEEALKTIEELVNNNFGDAE